MLCIGSLSKCTYKFSSTYFQNWNDSSFLSSLQLSQHPNNLLKQNWLSLLKSNSNVLILLILHLSKNMTFLWHLTHVYWASNWSFSLRTGPIKNLYFRKNNKAIKYESLFIFCTTYLAYIHLKWLNKPKIAKFITVLSFQLL